MSSAVDQLHEALPRARALAAQGKLAEAAAVLDALPPEARESSLFHHARGMVALQAQDVDRAVTSFREAVKLEPDIAEHRGALGSALLEVARRADAASRPASVEAARVELEAAWKLKPRTPDPGTTYGFALELAGRAEEAVGVLDEVLAAHPGHVPAWFNKASALRALGKKDEARAALDELLKLAPGFPPAVQARAKL